MKFKTSLTAAVVKNSNSLYVGLGSWQYSVSSKEFEDSLLLLEYLTEEKTDKQIQEFLENKGISNAIFHSLLNHKLITISEQLFHKEDSLDFKNGIYLDLVSSNPEKIMKKFKESTFVIIGCGSIGNYMSYALSVYSPKSMIIMDGDRIEQSNLNRQVLFSEEDIGLYKADVIARELKKRNKSLNIHTITNFVRRENISMLNAFVDKNSFGVISGDDDVAINVSSEYFLKNKIPFLNIGYLNDISVIGPFVIPGMTSCPFCNNAFGINGELESGNKAMTQIRKQYSSPSSFNNSTISCSLAMSDIVHFFEGNMEAIKSLNARVGINSSTFEKYMLKNSKDSNCLYCSGEHNDS